MPIQVKLRCRAKLIGRAPPLVGDGGRELDPPGLQPFSWRKPFGGVLLHVSLIRTSVSPFRCGPTSDIAGSRGRNEKPGRGGVRCPAGSCFVVENPHPGARSSRGVMRFGEADGSDGPGKDPRRDAARRLPRKNATRSPCSARRRSHSRPVLFSKTRRRRVLEKGSRVCGEREGMETGVIGRLRGHYGCSTARKAPGRFACCCTNFAPLTSHRNPSTRLAASRCEVPYLVQSAGRYFPALG